MTTMICTPEFTGYADVSFDAAKAAIVDGHPLTCWWYSSDGVRHEETFVFTDFRYIATCSELDADD